MSTKWTKKLEFFSVLHIKTFFRDKLANKSILDLDTLVKNTTSECNNFGFPRMKNCTRDVKKEHPGALFLQFPQKVLEYF